MSKTAICGCGLPTRAFGVVVLITSAPNSFKSNFLAAGTSPKPKVPLAGMIGFFKLSPGNFTLIFVISSSKNECSQSLQLFLALFYTFFHFLKTKNWLYFIDEGGNLNVDKL